MTRYQPATLAFLAASALSSVGNGLTFPVGALYLVRVRGLPVESATLFFAVTAIAGAVASLGFGRGMDRAGPRRYVVAGLVAEAAGLALFAHAGSWIAVAAAGAAIGAGNGLFFTGLTPLLARLESGVTLDRVFSVRYWLINLGNSLGALAGGALVTFGGDAALTPAYLVNAASSVALGATLGLVPLGAAACADAGTVGRAPLRWSSALVAVAVGHGLVVVFGMAMFEAVVPYVFVGGRDGPVPLAHAIVAASTVAIVLGQLPLGRWSEGRSKAAVLAIQSGIWAGAAGIGLAAVGTTGEVLWALGLGFGVVFGVGECLFAAGMQPLVVRVVQPAQLGAFNSVLSACYSVALAVGPALGFALVEHTSARGFWAVLCAAMVAAVGAWGYVARAGST